MTFLETFEEEYKKIEKLRPTNRNHISFEKLVLNLLKIYKSGTFRGQIHIKINDTDIYSPRIEQNTQWNRTFDYLD